MTDIEYSYPYKKHAHTCVCGGCVVPRVGTTAVLFFFSSYRGRAVATTVLKTPESSSAGERAERTLVSFETQNVVPVMIVVFQNDAEAVAAAKEMAVDTATSTGELGLFLSNGTVRYDFHACESVVQKQTRIGYDRLGQAHAGHDGVKGPTRYKPVALATRPTGDIPSRSRSRSTDSRTKWSQ